MPQREKKKYPSAKKDEFYTPGRESNKKIIESTERWKVWSTEDKSEAPLGKRQKMGTALWLLQKEDKIGKQKKKSKQVKTRARQTSETKFKCDYNQEVKRPGRKPNNN